MAEEKKNEKKADVSPKLSKLIKEIEGLSVLELAELVKILEDKFGVSAVVPQSGIPTTSVGSADKGDASNEEKSSFTVVLKGDGGKKIQVLKAVREVKQELTLVDAKKFVESLPKDLLTDVKKEEAEEVKKKLEAAGGEVELK